MKGVKKGLSDLVWFFVVYSSFYPGKDFLVDSGVNQGQHRRLIGFYCPIAPVKVSLCSPQPTVLL